MKFAKEHPEAVRRAGHAGGNLGAGAALFDAILQQRSGTVISVHQFENTWSLIRHKDHRIHLEIPEMLKELESLTAEHRADNTYPFVLCAGERRTYNANQIYRNPSWRKLDPHSAMRIHPLDAATLGLEDGSKARCSSVRGSIEVLIQVDDSVRRGMVTLPHGYGMHYRGELCIGPAVNQLTSRSNSDPLTRTPFHTHVPVRLEKLPA
jgi:anaerobic selenocysteine-containing dehydrogenase